MSDKTQDKTDLNEKDEIEENNLTQEDIENNERKEIAIFIEELDVKIQAKAKLREQNMKCERPAEDYFSRLDSSLRKNTAFVKKLRQFTATQLDVIMKDISNLNLTKYISEICSALSEAKLKMNDVQSVIILCSKLNQIYVEFSSQFFDAWQKVLSLRPGEKITNPSKVRVDLRLFAELISSGVINSKQGLPLLGNILTNIISQDKEDHSNFSIILSFCRHCGEEYAGLIPKRILELSKKYNINVPKSDFLTPEKQQNLRTMLKNYFQTLCSHLISEYMELQSMTKNVRRIMESKGEVSQEKREKCELMQANFDKLLQSAQNLSDLLAEELPELPRDQESSTPGNVLNNLLDIDTVGELDPWGDEETKSFYVDLPDLRLFLPNFCAPKTQDEVLPSEEPPITEETLDMDIEPDQLEVDDPPSNSSDPPLPSGSPEPPEVSATNVKPISSTNPSSPSFVHSSTSKTAAQSSSTGQLSMKQQFEHFLQNLMNCVNKELIDSAAIDFLLNFNTKNNRKKLSKCIFGVQRTRLDLFPFLARFVAIINLVSRDVAFDLCHMLKMEFKWHIKKKNQMNIESKIKIVRFIGELVKFGLYQKLEALFCLKILLHDFQHHQIEMACSLLEVCGQYLYNCRDTRLRTNVYLEQMIRLKTVTALDSRHSAQIESVYYLIKPPESLNKEKKVRPPLHDFIRHLIFEELNKNNVEKCIKIMRRLNWNDPEISSYAIKCLSKAYLLRFPMIRWLADLVSGLSSYQEKHIAKVIDAVFEDIRAGLEIHSPKLAQRRVAMAKYLGELYNYKLIDSTSVLNTLYSIISFGVSTEDGVYSPLDPPDSLFRLKLACILLETCGQYFPNTSSRKRLDYFLIFFQHYYWLKKSNSVFSDEHTSDLFPILADHMYKDCLAIVRPKLKLYKSLKEAQEAVEKLKKELYPQLFGESKTEEGAVGEAISNLEAIHEDSEFDEVSEESSDNGSDTEETLREIDEDLEDEQVEDQDDDRPMSPLDDQYDQLDIEQPIQQEKTQEDLEFEQMFEKMAADSYQERLRDVTVKPSTKDIPVPMMAKSNKKTYDQLQQPVPTTSLKTINNENNSEVPFVLMLRNMKSGKQQFRTFKAPSDSQLAINLKLQEQKIREENERVKRLTLNITERIEEEDYQESLMYQAQKSQQQSNRLSKQHNPSKQSKFKHQKGAPDAALIFN